MKTIQPLFTAFALVVAVGTAQAATPPYQVNDGYYGSVTIKASGSCGFKSVTYKNAWFGEVFDSTDTSQGTGIITASGALLVLEEDYAPIRHRPGQRHQLHQHGGRGAGGLCAGFLRL